MSNVTDDDIRDYQQNASMDMASDGICFVALGHQGVGVLSHMSQTMARALVELEIEAIRGVAKPNTPTPAGSAPTKIDLDDLERSTNAVLTRSWDTKHAAEIVVLRHVIALIARIRELENVIGVLSGAPGMVAIDGVGFSAGQVSPSPAVSCALRAVLEKGAVLP